MSDLGRRALAVVQGNLALGHEVFEADGATFVRNRQLSSIWDANHVANVTTSEPADVDRLLARIEREYAGFHHRRCDLDPRCSPEFEARLVLAGWAAHPLLVMLVAGPLAGQPPPADVRELSDAAGWSALEELVVRNWEETARRAGLSASESVGLQLAAAHRLKSPPRRYWLAWADGAPRGYFSSWAGIDGVGQVEDLFVHPEWRNRGFAVALVHRAVAACRADGARAVAVVPDATDTPKDLYARLGFRPLVVRRQYLLRLGADG